MDSGKTIPRLSAAASLITSSKVLGCSTGISAGLAPFRILSTYTAERRYKSSKLGWVEVMRQRVSQVPGQYAATERGFSITWTLGEARSQFFIEPGMFPADLADGASYWRPRRIKGRMTWTKGQIDLDSLEAGPGPRRLAGDPSAAPATAEKPDSGYHNVFRFQNGLVLEMQTRFLTAADGPASATGSYGNWDITVQADKSRKNYDVFLHTYFHTSGKTRKIISLLRIREDSTQ